MKSNIIVLLGAFLLLDHSIEAFAGFKLTNNFHNQLSKQHYVSHIKHTTSNSYPRFYHTQLLATAADFVDEVSSMRIGELKQELESYGISTKAMLEKKELVEALCQARAEGREKVSNTSSSASAQSSRASSSSTTGGGKSREQKIAEEMEKMKGMKVGEIKKELNDLGISTRTFFEKSEFIKALAEARVDGVKSNTGPVEEEYDPSYRDVVMQKFQKGSLPFGSGPIIDTKISK